ncbi:PTS sugar transporter subunit IIA [Enterococcus termitis]|uniref:PTS mannose transporter subunit IIAB n=1 Tax=Enterococcus termitis TaxID=332950 RepID=A0A1E5GI36_9ENTE|nr:PTS sugar transporter subunit IIA [Enterococcus termitis]OEG12255.1 PTS mannose transporter subunit IIAB [Enterococcus termitis]OJG98932.1 PTS system, fructose subfamily, IIA component domain protein [Enterococcus termitis]
MNVAQVIDIEQVLIDLEGTTQLEVIEQLADCLDKKGVLSNKAGYIQAVLEREKHSTTGVGNGIAIPHGKSSEVTEAAIAYAKLKEPVEWAALDDQSVSIVIMLAIPDGEKGETHLRLLSEIAVKLMDDDLVEALKIENDRVKIINYLG